MSGRPTSRPAPRPTPGWIQRLDRFDRIMAGVILLLVAALGIVILRGDQVGPGVRPASGPRIAYLGPVGGVVQNLYAVPMSGGTPEKLTTSKLGVMDFDILPTGKIVYSDQNLNGSTRLMFLDTATGQSSLLLDCGDGSCIEVAWRPDGKMIAFDRSELNTGTNLPPGAPRIWLYDLESKQTRRLFADNQKLGYMARWSPDGTKIAAWDSDRGGIVIFDFAKNEESIVPAYGGRVGDFSPDGTRIWFPRVVQVPNPNTPNDPDSGQYATHIAVADLTQQPYRVRDLIPDTAADDDTDPIWSADGLSFYLLRRPAGAKPDQDKQVYQVEIATGKAAPLIEDYTYAHSNLILSVDGRRLLMQRFKLGAMGARPELWVYTFETKELRRAVENGNLPRWLP